MAEETHRGLTLEVGSGGGGGYRGWGECKTKVQWAGSAEAGNVGKRRAKVQQTSLLMTLNAGLLPASSSWFYHLAAHTIPGSFAGCFHSTISTGVLLSLVLGPLRLCLPPVDNPCPALAVTTPERNNCEGLMTAGSPVPTSGLGPCPHSIGRLQQLSTCGSLLLLTA